MVRILRTLGLATAVAFFATACADFGFEFDDPEYVGEYEPADGLLPGPGTFTGEKGEWVIYSR